MNILKKTNKGINKLGSYFVLFIALILIVLLKNKFKNESQEIEDNGITTVCRIYDMQTNYHNYQDYIKYEYYIDNKKWLGAEGFSTGEIPNYTKIGDYFELRFLKKDNNIDQIQIDKKVTPDLVCSYFYNNCPFENEKSVYVDQNGTLNYAKIINYKTNVINKKILIFRIKDQGKCIIATMTHREIPPVKSGDSLRIKMISADTKMINLYFDNFKTTYSIEIE